MYIPSYYQIKDKTEIINIIKEHSFATLISQHNGAPVATHLPLLIDQEHQYLYGHFAKPNPQWRDIEGQTILAIFQGPHCYISPSWYETNQTVPTWNYVSVHVYGEVTFLDEAELQENFSELVKKYEKPDSSYQLEDVEDSYFSALAKGVQGFKIKIKEWQGKAKLSQNHSEKRREMVISELEKLGTHNEGEIAKLMERQK